MVNLIDHARPCWHDCGTMADLIRQLLEARRALAAALDATTRSARRSRSWPRWSSRPRSSDALPPRDAAMGDRPSDGGGLSRDPARPPPLREAAAGADERRGPRHDPADRQRRAERDG